MSGLIYALAVVGMVTVIFSLAFAFFLVGGWLVRVHDRRKRRGTATVVIRPSTVQFESSIKQVAENMRRASGGNR